MIGILFHIKSEVIKIENLSESIRSSMEVSKDFPDRALELEDLFLRLANEVLTNGSKKKEEI